jgi:hypothetical protein
MDLIEASRRKATVPHFDSATLNLSTNYEDFGDDYRDGSGEGKGKTPDQEIVDTQRAPGSTTSNKEDELDKTGIIFELIDKDTKVCLPSLGSCVKFNSLCLHKGFKDGEVKTNLSAQLLSAPKGNKRVVQGVSLRQDSLKGVSLRQDSSKGVSCQILRASARPSMRIGNKHTCIKIMILLKNGNYTQ